MEDNLSKEVAAIEALKEAVEQQGTVPDMSLKRSMEDSTGQTKSEKRGRSNSFKDTSLNALADATASGSIGNSSPFPFPYGYNPLGNLYGFGQTMIEPEAYQQMIIQQQQMRYYEGMREMVRSHGDESEGITSPAKKGRSKSANIPSASQTAAAYATGQYTGRFVLLEQPNVRQRKSYKNENRYVLPNPLTICAREEAPGEKLPRIIEGEATVSLVNAEGQDLPPTKQNLLESPEGGLTQTLDSNLSAHFSLKVLDTSEGTMFRLLFTINFTLDGVGPCEEKILSRPFQVYSNRKKNVKGQEKPSVVDIKPKEGPATQDTEVWIKGRGFSDRVVVAFGDKLGRIVETTENLITVFAPARFDLMSDTPVQVLVSNKYPHELLSADKKLQFVYYTGM